MDRSWTRWSYFALMINYSVPHYKKLLIITYFEVWAYIHHPHIRAFLDVSFIGYMNEKTHDSPRLNNIHGLPGVSYTSYSSVSCLHACFQVLAMFYSLSTPVFRVWAVWATDELARDLFDVCKTTTQIEVKRFHCLRFNIDWVKAFAFQSDHRWASQSRVPVIFG